MAKSLERKLSIITSQLLCFASAEGAAIRATLLRQRQSEEHVRSVLRRRAERHDQA